MDKEIEILSKLIEKRRDGVAKSKLVSTEKEKEILNKMIKDELVTVKKFGKGEKVFITEKGEVEFIRRMSKDKFQDFLMQKVNEIHDEIKKLNENFKNLMDILSIRNEIKPKIDEKIELSNEIYKTYKELSTKDYSFMSGLVPIPSLVANLIQKYNLKLEDIHKKIYELYLKGEVILEYGDKKEGNLVTPEGKSFYYIKFKK